MDKLNDILSHLKERLTSPLFFSFIISWIFCNWQVSIALLWWNPEHWGGKTIFEFIQANISNWNSIYLPLLFSLLYTFAYPFVTIAFTGVQTWVTKLSEQLQLRISKDHKVSMDRYLEEKKKVKSKSEELQKILEEDKINLEKAEAASKAEIAAKEQLQQQLAEVTRKQEEINDKEKSILNLTQRLNNFRNVSLLDGDWIYTNTHGGETQTLNLEIKTGYITIVQNDGKRYRAFDMSSFFYDANVNYTEIIFIKTPGPQIKDIAPQYLPRRQRAYYVTKLKWEISHFVGSENDEAHVTYRKADKAFQPEPSQVIKVIETN